MKKLLIATVLSTLALSAQAQWYVQGDVGASRIDLIDESANDTVFNQRISVGYDFGEGFRLALDYTNHGKATANVSTYGPSVDVDVKVKSLGLTGFYDFETNSNVKPYLGVRVSSNKIDVSAKAESYNTSYGYGYYRGYSAEASASETRTGIGALAGIQYKLTDNLSLNANIEYNRLTADLSDAGVKAGLRFNF